MAQNEKRFSHEIRCEHCSNAAPLEIVAEYSGVKRYDDYPRSNNTWESGSVYELLRCPACDEVTLRSYYWGDPPMEPPDITYRTLYPSGVDRPVGLPDRLARAFDAAQKVRNIDANAYGVLLGRLLELVCHDRKATGRYLANKLGDLASKGEIPDKLVSVANGLKDLRNVGAHPTLGELTGAELPILDRLCRAILEYVYSAPYIAQQAETCLQQLKDKTSPESSGDGK